MNNISELEEDKAESFKYNKPKYQVFAFCNLLIHKNQVDVNLKSIKI